MSDIWFPNEEAKEQTLLHAYGEICISLPETNAVFIICQYRGNVLVCVDEPNGQFTTKAWAAVSMLAFYNQSYMANEECNECVLLS